MSFYSLIQKFHPDKRKESQPIREWVFIPFDQISYYNSLINIHLSPKDRNKLNLYENINQDGDEESDRIQCMRREVCFIFIETST